MSMTDESATNEWPAVTRLRALARNALELEEIRNFEGQDADEVLAYIDRLTKGKAMSIVATAPDADIQRWLAGVFDGSVSLRPSGRMLTKTTGEIPARLRALADALNELKSLNAWWHVDQSIGDAEEGLRPAEQIEARQKIASVLYRLVPPE